MYVCLYVCLYMYVCIYVCLYMYVCMYMVYMYVCMYMWRISRKGVSSIMSERLKITFFFTLFRARSCGSCPGGLLPSKRLLEMCHWMGSHFHNWTDYNGVTFLVELLELGRKFSGFLA